jgi:hypothetical protein
MPKEPYLSPEVRSETMGPEALCNGGSTVTGTAYTADHERCWLKKLFDPSCGFCCED